MKSKAAQSPALVIDLQPCEAERPRAPLPEFKLKKILVPIDFSEPSRKALQYANCFARQFNAEILLLHIIDPTPLVVTDTMGGITALNQPEFERNAARQLREWRKEITPEAFVQTSTRTGNPQVEIIRAAEENNIDLIIIGRHGRVGLARFFLGSTAEHVLRHAPCPALVVREREHDFVAAPEGQSASKLNRPRGNKPIRLVRALNRKPVGRKNKRT